MQITIISNGSTRATYLKNLFVLPALIASLGLTPAGRVKAQNFTNLHSFGFEGATPYSGLTVSGSTLYGTVNSGGNSGYGTVFAVSTNGTGFTSLYDFTGLIPPDYTNSDGARPRAGLLLSGNTLYGTTQRGGGSDKGTVFAVNTDGGGFMTLHTFTNGSDGATPYAGVILAGDTLYGTASAGGSSGNGTVFAVKTNGTGFTTLHSFAVSDGAIPYGGLVLSGNNLYGTTEYSLSGNGEVFKLSTNGTGFAILHSFTYSDGSQPWAGLILSGNALYGTTSSGGSSGNGSVFALNTDGSGFTNLHSFSYPDGVAPYAGLVLSGNTLYGTATGGGTSPGDGTVFAVHTDGTGFTNLHTFTPISGGPSYSNSDGAHPYGGLVLSGNTLYGTALDGGTSGKGVVFSLSFPPPPPQLNIASAGAQSVLFWPASGTNFILQSTTNLSSPNWVTATDAVPVLAFTVTNTSPARFFRLHQQQ